MIKTSDLGKTSRPNNKETMLDEEELIEAVEARPQLYDKTDPKYSNREYTRLAWDEVAMELNVDVEVLRKRWSSLRDYFMKQVRMEKRSVRRRKWPLFDAMGFLLPYVQSRNSPYDDNGFDNSDNNNSFVCKNEIQPASSVSMQEAEQTMTEREQAPEPSPESPTYVYPTSRPFKSKKRKHLSESIVDVDDSNSGSPKTSNVKEHEEEDDDILFFKSLLPAMKNLSSLDRFEFRHEVQGLLLNYLRKEEQLKRKSHHEVDEDCG